MAHKTLIGGTAYEIKGGKTLIGGTAYKIESGKTLVGGTAYDISFAKPFVDFGTFETTYNTYNQYYDYMIKGIRDFDFFAPNTMIVNGVPYSINVTNLGGLGLYTYTLDGFVPLTAMAKPTATHPFYIFVGATQSDGSRNAFFRSYSSGTYTVSLW